MEETLDHRVIPAITLAAHAALHIVLRQELSVFTAGILAATV
jgi:hypothetical protein